MGIVTSYFPGHIRLRASILKDLDIASAAIKAIEDLGFIGTFSHNPKTGSILVEYDPKQITPEKLERLKPMLSGIMALKRKVVLYNPKDKEFMLSEIERLSKEASMRLG